MDCVQDGIRYNWYQTDAHVVVSIFIKQMKEENIRVDLTENTLTCIARSSDSNECCFQVNLAHEICTKQCTWKALSTKIEIKLKKVNAIRWESLKSEEKSKESKVEYPSSNKLKRDWDKLAQQAAKEEEEEKLEGDAALNQMFQRIYSEGSDETRKAMNKSFMESGGTVLSTNWKEVNEKKVDIKPPEGMEWKKWDS